MAEQHRPKPGARTDEPAELRKLRHRIDVLDRRIVKLLNDRAELARAAGRVKADTGRRAIRDPEREREVLLRVSIANAGPTPQADLLAIFKRLFTIARGLERIDRTRAPRAEPFGGVPEVRGDD